MKPETKVSAGSGWRLLSETNLKHRSGVDARSRLKIRFQLTLQLVCMCVHIK